MAEPVTEPLTVNWLSTENVCPVNVGAVNEPAPTSPIKVLVPVEEDVKFCVLVCRADISVSSSAKAPSTVSAVIPSIVMLLSCFPELLVLISLMAPTIVLAVVSRLSS